MDPIGDHDSPTPSSPSLTHSLSRQGSEDSSWPRSPNVAPQNQSTLDEQDDEMMAIAASELQGDKPQTNAYLANTADEEEDYAKYLNLDLAMTSPMPLSASSLVPPRSATPNAMSNLLKYYMEGTGKGVPVNTDAYSPADLQRIHALAQETTSRFALLEQASRNTSSEDASSDEYPFSTGALNAIQSQTDSLMTELSAASSATIDPTLVSDAIHPDMMEQGSTSAVIKSEETEPLAMPARTRTTARRNARSASVREASESPAPPRSSSRPRRANGAPVPGSVAALTIPASKPTPPIVLPAKRTAASTSGSTGHLPHIVIPAPDYVDKPSAEEYQQLNSKEKRQMRNKISARNFRHRRKEYITQLEEEIADRDEIISDLQAEMSGLKLANTELKSEVGMLKDKWDSVLTRLAQGGFAQAATSTSGSSASATVSASTSPSSVASSDYASVKAEHNFTASARPEESIDSSTQMNAQPETPQASTSANAAARRPQRIAKPNLSKDLSHAGSAWGPGGFAPFHSNLNVHRTMLPTLDLSTRLSGKLSEWNSNLKLPSADADSLYADKPAQENMNPALNGKSREDFAAFTQHLRSLPGAGRYDTRADFMAGNPLHLDPLRLKEYRSQLYGKVSNNASGLLASPLPAGLKPAYLTGSSAALLDEVSKPTKEDPQDVARVAGLAKCALVNRLGMAFCDAFKGPAAGEKLASVLSGKAKLIVAPTDPADALNDRLNGLSLTSNANTSRPGSPSGVCSFQAMQGMWQK
ncbi:uncharacterized protein L969DRAFT_48485 [Mixia osmundae IAM 14324]|uniref:BZIP domain-containing protein n=1 Tax=Mixia osmundae (strain CBS 9802 / IAM 14324 / JCM 22182 / KY 12970) TaxID=764103 RepID=G7E3B2_MIXOS|nr:uncharacterized protein L969DRAFT_48485 [Mixia osmundae IAM 14324]KEI39309.1 hypothetical protein L969DRAFT_48485 [Mixia osmundae IAM 14324]GAA97322.1 hypothetical protein E5Q_04000 [Mixia osmundae IAM 14324]